MSFAAADIRHRNDHASAETEYRERCYVCFRPKEACFCSSIPSIVNRTGILILQHVKERFHAFNTARIVRHALRNCELLVDQTARLAKMELPLSHHTGVLYPGADATILSEVPGDHRPKQLVILDGTWHHAKTLMRDIPALQQLPRYRLDPERPSTYRIRREPTKSALSTVEATVAALRIMEPDTSGLDQLLAAFQRMIDDQVQHPEQAVRLRRRPALPRPAVNVPSALIHDIDNVVVAYGEACFEPSRKRHRGHSPIYWVARRLGTGESFECALNPIRPLTSAFLRHLELDEYDFRHAVPAEDFAESWQAFLRPTDTLCIYNESTARMIQPFSPEGLPMVSLKSVNVQRQCRTLDEVLMALELSPASVPQKGRSGRRLANAIAFAQYLHGLATVSR